MIYNKNALNKFLGRLGLQHEISRLTEGGLTYEEIATVVDSVLNPDSPSVDKGIVERVFTGSGSETSKKYKAIGYFIGIGTSEEQNPTSSSRLAGYERFDGIRTTMALFDRSLRHPAILNRTKKEIYQRAFNIVLENNR